MATKKSDEQNTTHVETERSSSATPISPSAEPPDQQIAELKELTRSLMVAVQAMQTQSARNAVFQDAIADVKSATKAMLVASPGVSIPPRADVRCDDCSACGCISEKCCAFEIFMTDVRVTHMQTPLAPEVGDTNIGVPPIAGPMEVRIFASVDGIGAMIPDAFGYLSLDKLANQPGVWSQVNRPIGTIQVCKGTPKTIEIRVDALEVETQGERLLPFNRDEYGTGSQKVILDCCVCRIDVPAFDVQFTGGGQGEGAIEVRFRADRKC